MSNRQSAPTQFKKSVASLVQGLLGDSFALRANAHRFERTTSSGADLLELGARSWPYRGRFDFFVTAFVEHRRATSIYQTLYASDGDKHHRCGVMLGEGDEAKWVSLGYHGPTRWTELSDLAPSTALAQEIGELIRDAVLPFFGRYSNAVGLRDAAARHAAASWAGPQQLRDVICLDVALDDPAHLRAWLGAFANSHEVIEQTRTRLMPAYPTFGRSI